MYYFIDSCYLVYRFIYADIGAEGRMSDGGIFSRSSLCRALTSNLINIPPPKPVDSVTLPHVILADEAFPLTNTMMRPYSLKDLNHNRRIFNYRLCRARRVIENCFGIMTATWRVFEHKQSLQPAKVCTVTKACVVLHNFLRSTGQQCNITVDTDNTPGNWRRLPRPDGLPSFDSQPLRPAVTAKEVREQFTEYFNGRGRVEWQEAAIA